MTNFKISYPNDHDSQEDYAEMVVDLFGGDEQSVREDDIFDALATRAKEAGLTFVTATDYGAIWSGSVEQGSNAKRALATWAQKYFSVASEQ